MGQRGGMPVVMENHSPWADASPCAPGSLFFSSSSSVRATRCSNIARSSVMPLSGSHSVVTGSSRSKSARAFAMSWFHLAHV